MRHRNIGDRHVEHDEEIGERQRKRRDEQPHAGQRLRLGGNHRCRGGGGCHLRRPLRYKYPSLRAERSNPERPFAAPGLPRRLRLLAMTNLTGRASLNSRACRSWLPSTARRATDVLSVASDRLRYAPAGTAPPSPTSPPHSARGTARRPPPSPP